MSFKDKYCDELRRLRVYIDGRLAEMATIEDEVVRRARVASTLQEISDDVAALTEQMDKRQWPKASLVGVGGVVSSALTGAQAIATGGAALNVGLAVGAAALAAGVQGYQAVEMMGPRYNRRAPLVYAALTSRL